MIAWMLTVQRISSRTVFSVVVRECWRRMQEVVMETSGTMWARWSNRSKVNVVFCCIYKGGTMQLKTTTTASLYNTLQTCTCTSISRKSVGSKWITDEVNTADNGPHIGKKKIIEKNNNEYILKLLIISCKYSNKIS